MLILHLLLEIIFLCQIQNFILTATLDFIVLHVVIGLLLHCMSIAHNAVNILIGGINMNYCSECSHRGVCGTLDDLCKEKNIIFAGEKILLMDETESCDRFEPDKETAMPYATKSLRNGCDLLVCPRCTYWFDEYDFEYCPRCGQHIDWSN